MRDALLVFFGAGLGGVCRYGFGVWLRGQGFEPWVPTLAVNLIGAFVIGCLAGSWMERGQWGWALFAVGILGGFTTLSGLSLDALDLIREGRWGLAAGYGLGSVVGGVGLCGLGFWIVGLGRGG